MWVIDAFYFAFLKCLFSWLKHISVWNLRTLLHPQISFLSPEMCLNSGFCQWWLLTDSPLLWSISFLLDAIVCLALQEGKGVSERGRHGEGFPMHFFLCFSTVGRDSRTVPRCQETDGLDSTAGDVGTCPDSVTASQVLRVLCRYMRH